MSQLQEGRHRDCVILSGSDEEPSFDVEPCLMPLAMTLTVFVLGGLLFAVSPAFAQDAEPLPSRIAVGIRAATPVGSAANLLGTAPPVTLGHGYRFNRPFQTDRGIQTPFRPANNRNVVVTDFGPVHLFGGSDPEYFQKSAINGSSYSPTCFSCASGGSWGDSLTTRSYPLGSRLSLWVGSTVQYAGPNGFSVPSVLANCTTDRWMNLTLAFGFTF